MKSALRTAMNISDFDYHLPPELIAQHPPRERGMSRMLVLDRVTGACRLHRFGDFPEHLRAGDCLVVNDTQVIPARLKGRRKATGGRVEALLIEQLPNGHWHSLLKPGRRMTPGQVIELPGAPDDTIRVEKRRDDGSFELSFPGQEASAVIARHGAVPLPPYIQRDATTRDTERYQTVFAAAPGAVAAPTAGLHFTTPILDRIRERGVRIATLTLHVGPGTFRPVQVERIREHRMHEERYVLPQLTAEQVNRTRADGGRVIAVGTTAVRVLESVADPNSGRVTPGSGRTCLFMHPPMTPNICDGLLTNFHLPRSTLLMLVSTFSSIDTVLHAYRLAIRERLRFYSYGDCMLLIAQ